MLRLVVLRLLAFVPTLLAASLVLFVAINVVPGSAARSALGIDATPQAIARFEAENGLDRPLYLQYADWLGKVLHGDFGTSFQSHVPVGPEILARLPVTLELAILAFLVANLTAVPLGALAAWAHQRPADTAITLLATVFGAIPNFWLATLLILAASFWFQWSPALIYVPPTQDLLANLQQMLLPTLSLAVFLTAIVMRMTRSTVLEVLGEDYVRTAFAKGLHERLVLARHVLRNALIPVVTIIGLQAGTLLGGVVVVEQIFGLPGLGWTLLNGIYQRDYPVVQGTVLFFALVFALFNLLVDLTYAYLDPRIRYS